MDILLTHAYYLYEDPKERAIMRPYPPLGILYISSHLKAKGFDVGVFDTTFSRPKAFEAYVAKERPAVVGIYANLMTRSTVLAQIRVCRTYGATVIVGGPEPVNYVEEYLARGADVVVVGEGERTLEALLPHLARYGPAGMEHLEGIAYRADEHRVVRTAPRPHRAFQGWRYYAAEDAPLDLEDLPTGIGDMPPELVAELHELGLL